MSKTIIWCGEQINFPVALILEETDEYCSYLIAEDAEIQQQEDQETKELVDRALNYKDCRTFKEKKKYLNKDDVLAHPQNYLNYEPVNEQKIIDQQTQKISELEDCILQMSQVIYG